MSKKKRTIEEHNAVEEVRDFYTKTRRWDEAHGRETPVYHLGEKSDYNLHDEQDARLYEMGRYSTEATDELGRKSRARVFSMPNLPWVGKKKGTP